MHGGIGKQRCCERALKHGWTSTLARSLGVFTSLMGAALTVAMLAAPVASASCGDVEYVGAANGSWQEKANWSGGNLPTSAQTVCIPSGKGTVLIPNGLTADAKILLAQSGVKVEAGGTLAIAEKVATEPAASTFTSLTDDGVLSTAGSKLLIKGSATVNGEITQAGGAGEVQLQSGTFSGNGGLIVPPFTVSGGTLQPGGAGTIGTLSFGTLFTLHNAGTLAIDIASGSSFDRIEDAGNTFFQGTIAVNLLGGYSPSIGEQWAFAKAGGTSFESATTTPSYFTSRAIGGGESGIELISPIVTPPSEEHKETQASSGSGNSSGSGQVPGLSSSAPGVGVAATPQAVEELLLGCGKAALTLSNVYIHGGRVQINGSAAKSLVGKKVKILFGTHDKQVATATVGADGRYATTAPLPPARIRESLSTRYTAQLGSLRSLHLKLTRRLLLETPKASASTVTLTGRVFGPLTKPTAPIVVEQQLECHKTTIVKKITPPASGLFHITLTVPAGAKAAIYTLKSSVAANTHSTKHGFTTYSLPLPVQIG